ncbi:hypothetical protein J1614_006837, partial [Plenodomus biglobosus]
MDCRTIMFRLDYWELSRMAKIPQPFSKIARPTLTSSAHNTALKVKNVTTTSIEALLTCSTMISIQMSKRMQSYLDTDDSSQTYTYHLLNPSLLSKSISHLIRCVVWRDWRPHEKPWSHVRKSHDFSLDTFRHLFKDLRQVFAFISKLIISVQDEGTKDPRSRLP